MVAKRHGARLAILNREPTEQDDYADLVVHAGIGAMLSAAVARLLPARARHSDNFCNLAAYMRISEPVPRFGKASHDQVPAHDCVARLDEGEDEEREKEQGMKPDQPMTPVQQALFKSRTVLIFGEIDMKVAERVVGQMIAYAAEGDERHSRDDQLAGRPRGIGRHDPRHDPATCDPAC